MPSKPSSVRVFIQAADFDISAEIDAMRAAAGEPQNGSIGAICTFTGTVRDRVGSNEVTSLELEHYPSMTERSIEAMIDDAFRRFDLIACRVVHRVGVLQARDRIVLVAVASRHRADSFKACEFLMDYLKTHAPFWKKESTPAGSEWVDARVSDDVALARWNLDKPGNAAGR